MLRIFSFIICLTVLSLLMAGNKTLAYTLTHRGGNGSNLNSSVSEIIPTAQKQIALTFDDGPTLDETSQILDVLKEYEAKATFFLVGSRVERYQDIVRREVEEGHEIANHTYHHLICQPGVSMDQLRKDIKLAQNSIIRVSAYKPHLFRPVQGFYNKQLLKVLEDEGLQMVLWSPEQDSWDWDRPGVSHIVKTVLNHVNSGDIILLHDHVNGKSDTISALKIILPELKRQGFEFVTVSELLKNQELKD